MNAVISETIRARLLGFGMQTPKLLAQRKFVSVRYHAHSYAHKPPKTGSYSFDARIKILTDMYCSHQ